LFKHELDKRKQPKTTIKYKAFRKELLAKEKRGLESNKLPNMKLLEADDKK